MRVTLAGARRTPARAVPAAAGACADIRAGSPVSTAPTTPLSDFAKPLRSSAICHLPRASRELVCEPFVRVVAADDHNDGVTRRQPRGMRASWFRNALQAALV